MRHAGIYAIYNPASDKYYVGQAQNILKRWRKHRFHLNRGDHHSKHLQAAWDKYGENSFEFFVLEFTYPETSLDAAEQCWIDKLKAFENGYNAVPIAGTRRGYKHRPETVAKISAAQKGRQVPAERRKLISQSLTGKTQSEETRQKRNEKLRGKKRSEESVRRLAGTHRARNNTPKHEAFGEALYLEEWAARYGLHISTLRNRIKRGGMLLEEALLMPSSKDKRRDLEGKQ